jgi:hypothetical protein
MLKPLLSLCVAALVSLSCACPADAGVLNGAAGALTSGAVPYNNGNNLSGTIDYAVFTASAFNSAFGGTGYAPTDAYVYTYQVLNAGSDNFSQLTVGISNPASGIGTFSIGAVDVSSALFDGSGNAEYQFLSPSVMTGQSSYGLAFSAPTLPIDSIAIISDGGGSLQIGLPAPGIIPEPTSVCLALMLGGSLAATRRRR